MQHRGFEYTIVQSIERGHWRWSVNVAGIIVLGTETTKAAATEEAIRAIDRAMAPRKIRLLPFDETDS